MKVSVIYSRNQNARFWKSQMSILHTLGLFVCSRNDFSVCECAKIVHSMFFDENLHNAQPKM